MTYVHADPLIGRETLRATRRRPVSSPGFPETALFLESGRVALWAALLALGLRAGDRLVAPGYICDSILPALTALGTDLRFVPTDRTLAPDLAAVELELARGARACLAVHYFGFPAPQFEALAALCRQYGAALIEDCAHALYSRSGQVPLGQRGDAALFSPWKSLPLTDGGLLALKAPIVPPKLTRLGRPPLPSTARRLAYRLIPVLETALGRTPRLSLLGSCGLRRALQTRAAQAPLVPRRGSALAEAILWGTDWQAVVARRRANYLRLLSALRGASWAHPLYSELPAGVSPLGLPLLVEAREPVRRALLGAGVNVRAYWEQLPAAVTVDAFADAHYVANRILILPVHQSLTRRQLGYLESRLARLGAP